FVCHSLSWNLLAVVSVLFPYTTLFRSYRLVVPKNLAAANRRSGWRELADLPWIDGPHGSHTHLLLRDLFERHGLTPRTVMHSDEDRKSTRLNSSHVKSSYAVFCLKKKK